MDQSIPVRFFGPELPSTGVDASLRLVSGIVEVHMAQGTRRANISALRLREVVSVHRGLELAWDDARGTFAAHIYDEATVRALQAHPDLAGAPQVQALRNQQRRQGIGRRLGWTLIAIFLLLPLLLLLAFVSQADRIAGAMASRIPVPQESALGRAIFTSMKPTLKLRDDSVAAQTVRNLGEQLAQGSRYRYEFHVAEDGAINAFALPGGVIVVHTGLISAAKRPEELAGVLAHEIQHVELRHSLRSMLKELGMRGLWGALTGDVGGTMAGQAALKLTSLRFSRDAESEADARGFESLVRLDIDPSGMVDFFGTMGKTAGVTPPTWLSTHPASEARQESLRAKQEALGDRKFPPLQMAWPPQP